MLPWLKPSSNKRRTCALFSSDIDSLLLPPAFPAGCGSTQLYCGAKRSAAPEPNTLFSRIVGKLLVAARGCHCPYSPSFLEEFFSAIGLPLNHILGNSEGMRAYRKSRDSFGT